MKLSLSFVSFALAGSAAAAAFSSDQQTVFGSIPKETYPGFDLDLNAQRLVQLSDASEPVWMSELDKARIYMLFSPLKLTALDRDADSPQGKGHQVLRHVSPIPCPHFSSIELCSTDSPELGFSKHLRTQLKGKR